MMSSEQLKAFDVSREPAAVRTEYGDTPFGRGCLAARRLIEVGVRCVEVTLGGWDTHANNHALHDEAARDPRPGVRRADPRPARARAARPDRRDLRRRVRPHAEGQPGRRPRPLADGFSVALAGGGIRGGTVVGATDPEGKADPTDPVTVGDLHATVLTAVGIDPASSTRRRSAAPCSSPRASRSRRCWRVDASRWFGKWRWSVWRSALVLLTLAAGCQTDDPPPEPSGGHTDPPSQWHTDPLPAACRPDLLNEGLPYRWEPGAVHLLAWATVADDYWDSEVKQAVVVKQFDRPTERGHRWVLALVYHNPKDPERPWDGPQRHFAPPFPGDPPALPTDAQWWGHEFYADRPTDEQVGTFLRECGWDPALGTREAMLSNATKVNITRTLIAGGVDTVAWRQVFDREVPLGLFPELRKSDRKERAATLHSWLRSVALPRLHL